MGVISVFHIVVENGEAFFISDELWLDFLEMRAEGRSLDLHRYGTYIGDVMEDVTEMTSSQAAKHASIIRKAQANAATIVAA